ncbi:transposase [Aliikangiella marina]|uniref:Transposase n=1 Tax=Aliikangiella marina TaxID=1712262 RepID=A0A545T8N0_9GAMM|nr:transposase [Aliikangiella marina]TQV73572.1 transposase [Aliikangiella marina]
MATKRSELIDSENASYYHLVSRCVRRAFLCGVDEESGHSYEHRREWIEKRIIELADIFSIEVYGYAVMHNHYHLVVYSDPLAPQKWTDEEVAERWLRLFPGKLDDPKFALQRELKLRALIEDHSKLAEYRIRLGSLSWLMRCINEPIAKRSNKEDFVKGHFWESRFKSQVLLDEAAALACMAYVDLNPVRAGITTNLENSEFTSIHKRLRSISQEKLNQSVAAIAGKVRNRTMTIPLKNYIELVDWTGKYIVHADKAKIPANISSTLEGLNLNKDSWLNELKCYRSNYYRAIGPIHLLLEYTNKIKQTWVKGISNIRSLYLPPG